ncbi:MAG: hypothetical protein HC844_01495 [Tabrizicola sp.]|nr:hypothetical protein [Tabrizicola sp.]
MRLDGPDPVNHRPALRDLGSYGDRPLPVIRRRPLVLAPLRPDADDVAGKADRIEKLISSSGWFQWVSKGEISDAVQTLKDADAETAKAVVAELDERGRLDDLFDEIYDGSHVGGGLEGDDRRAFFEDMAGKLDGASLARMANEAKRHGGYTGLEAMTEFAGAVAAHASSDAKVEFVRSLADETLVSDTTSSAFAFVDPDAVAIATVLASMGDDPASLRRAMASLDDKQLQSVMYSSVDRVVIGPAVVDDVDGYVALADAVAQLDASDPAERAQIRRFIGFSMDRLGDDEFIRRLQPEYKDALTSVFLTHFDDLLGASLSDNGAIDREFAEDIESFAHFILFSDPAGESLQELQHSCQSGSPIWWTWRRASAAMAARDSGTRQSGAKRRRTLPDSCLPTA